jgi:hypothetical protein
MEIMMNLTHKVIPAAPQIPPLHLRKIEELKEMVRLREITIAKLNSRLNDALAFTPKAGEEGKLERQVRSLTKSALRQVCSAMELLGSGRAGMAQRDLEKAERNLHDMAKWQKLEAEKVLEVVIGSKVRKGRRV